jgi:hypothetical protein
MVAGIGIATGLLEKHGLLFRENSTRCSPMSDPDQDIAAELARIRAEWERLEAWRGDLEEESAEWRAALLAEADRIGVGERMRSFTRPRPLRDQETC